MRLLYYPMKIKLFSLKALYFLIYCLVDKNLGVQQKLIALRPSGHRWLAHRHRPSFWVIDHNDITRAESGGATEM